MTFPYVFEKSTNNLRYSRISLRNLKGLFCYKYQSVNEHWHAGSKKKNVSIACYLAVCLSIKISFSCLKHLSLQ